MEVQLLLLLLLFVLLYVVCGSPLHSKSTQDGPRAVCITISSANVRGVVALRRSSDLSAGQKLGGNRGMSLPVSLSVWPSHDT